MNISGVSTGNMQSLQATMQQRKQDFSQLATALQGGDLAAAQKAFADLQSLNGQKQNSTATSTGKSSNPVANDLNSLGQALQAGTLTDAQSIFAQLQKDMQTQKSGQHRHHHGGAGTSGASTSGQSSATSTQLPDNSTISVSA